MTTPSLSMASQYLFFHRTAMTSNVNWDQVHRTAALEGLPYALTELLGDSSTLCPETYEKLGTNPYREWTTPEEEFLAVWTALEPGQSLGHELKRHRTACRAAAQVCDIFGHCGSGSEE